MSTNYQSMSYRNPALAKQIAERKDYQKKLKIEAEHKAFAANRTRALAMEAYCRPRVLRDWDAALMMNAARRKRDAARAKGLIK